MAFSPAEFRAQLTGSGARPNLFNVQITWPSAATNGNAQSLVTFLARAASLPPANVGTITLPYFGRDLKFPGDRTFPEWTITVINDENFAVRDGFIQWSNAINNFAGNLRDADALTPASYSSDINFYQYSKIGGSPIKTIILRGAFPVSVGDITTDWGVKDTIEEFPVSFMYEWWEDSSVTT